MAVDSTHVYISGFNDNTLYRAPLPSGDPEVLYTATAAIGYVLVRGDTVYWSTYNGEIYEAAKDGSGDPSLLATITGTAYGFQFDESNVYAVNYEGTVFRAPQGGGAAEAIATIPTGSPIDLLFNEAGDGFLITVQDAPTVYTLPIDGGDPVDAFNLGGGKDGQQAAKDGSLLYISSYAASEVLCLETSTGEAAVYVGGTETASATGAALDESYFYWSTYFERQVWRIER
jgi:outer membrane protein assembly factor BamB